jgi:quercetin dioxygenase-like cupin family protein
MTHLIKHADTRTTVTPNATMTTLASPTVGATDGHSLWLVEMAADARGPLHVFDSGQIWTVLEGRVEIELGGLAHALEAGDTLVIPGAVARQVHAISSCRMLVCGDGAAAVTVVGENESRGTPAWIC